jgi:rubredoxin
METLSDTLYDDQMPRFTELDPEACLAAIEGHEDILTGEAQKMEAFYRQHVCPVCKSSCHKEFSPFHAFSDGSLIPRALLRCNECNHLFDPHSGITVERGEHGRPFK